MFCKPPASSSSAFAAFAFTLVCKRHLLSSKEAALNVLIMFKIGKHFEPAPLSNERKTMSGETVYFFKDRIS